jgi:hypothetical protein
MMIYAIEAVGSGFVKFELWFRLLGSDAPSRLRRILKIVLPQ